MPALVDVNVYELIKINMPLTLLYCFVFSYEITQIADGSKNSLIFFFFFLHKSYVITSLTQTLTPIIDPQQKCF